MFIYARALNPIKMYLQGSPFMFLFLDTIQPQMMWILIWMIFFRYVSSPCSYFVFLLSSQLINFRRSQQQIWTITIHLSPVGRNCVRSVQWKSTVLRCLKKKIVLFDSFSLQMQTKPTPLPDGSLASLLNQCALPSHDHRFEFRHGIDFINLPASDLLFVESFNSNM